MSLSGTPRDPCKSRRRGVAVSMNKRRPNRPTYLNRRDLLRAGALGMGLPGYLSLSRKTSALTPQETSGFGKARSCIVIFAWGGLSHIDTLDLKPDAGSNIKSAFGSIPTTIPGYHVCEHLPLLSKQVHRMTLIRSMHHDAPSHRSPAYWNLTGHAPAKPDKNWPRTRKDWPSIGSMVAHARHDPGSKLPGNVAATREKFRNRIRPWRQEELSWKLSQKK